MKKPRKNHGNRLTSTGRVELYFSRILERQRLEEEYYRTGNAALLAEIDRAREMIREAMRGMGIH